MLSISNDLYALEPKTPDSYDIEDWRERKAWNAEKQRVLRDMRKLGWKYRDFKDRRAANMARGRFEKALGVPIEVYEYNYLGL